MATIDKYLRRLTRLERYAANHDYQSVLELVKFWKINFCRLAKAYEKAGNIGCSQYALAIGALFDTKSAYSLGVNYASGQVMSGIPDYEQSKYYMNLAMTGDETIKVKCCYWLAQFHFQSLITGADYHIGKAFYDQAKELDPDGKIEKKVKRIINNILKK